MHLPNLPVAIQISCLKVHGCYPPLEHPFGQHFLPSLSVELSKVQEELSQYDSTGDYLKYRENTPQFGREAFIPIAQGGDRGADAVEGIHKAQLLNLPQKYSSNNHNHRNK